MSVGSPTTSLSLLECLKQSAPGEAWTRFVRLYTPLLYGWARRHGFHHDDAADLSQEVLVKLLHELPRFTLNPKLSFRSWLFRVTANQCIDFRRRRRTRLEADGKLVADRGATDPALTEFEENEYRRYVVHRALNLIQPEFTSVIWERFERVMLRGEPVGEVARVLGLTENAVHLARHRVLTRLRQEIDGLLE